MQVGRMRSILVDTCQSVIGFIRSGILIVARLEKVSDTDMARPPAPPIAIERETSRDPDRDDDKQIG
jgi:hypothetical protein